MTIGHTDTDVVRRFVDHLRNNGFPNIRIDKIPDKDADWPPTTRIDAIAGPFAIEHTRVDLDKKRGFLDSSFASVFVPLEEKFAGRLDRHISVIVPMENVRKGQDWGKIAEKLEEIIGSDLCTLPYGNYHISKCQTIPFDLNVTIGNHLPNGLFFTRSGKDYSVEQAHVRKKLNEKVSKLGPYSPQYRTILLVESDDLPQMNESLMTALVGCALDNQLPKGIDQIWYASTQVESSWRFERIDEQINRTGNMGPC